MGKIYAGIHPKIALELRNKFHLKYFVETGTNKGKSAHWASKNFKYVYTIELNEDFYFEAIKRYFKNNITFILGDSRSNLSSILTKLPRPALFWLDAHWHSTKYSKSTKGECPLLDELDIIVNDKKDHVLMIDDARYFLNPPPKPHVAKEWPTFLQIEGRLNNKYATTIRDDVIIAIPIFNKK